MVTEGYLPLSLDNKGEIIMVKLNSIVTLKDGRKGKVIGQIKTHAKAIEEIVKKEIWQIKL